MIVYRITLAKYSNQLVASGRPARWNSNGTFMIYSASSRALACLENLVHRGSEGRNDAFKTLVIDIPDNIIPEEYPKDRLPKRWTTYKGQLRTKFIGDGWIKSRRSLIMKVPSAIIPEESNYLINPNHPDYPKVRIISVEDFNFDMRI
ncbi:MAG TPA: RES family NAD+ phosphorylase [Fulvivirga sp.]|nr:RES family NAD+ phosphorylase [Fulvivirga sp.]